MGRAIDRLVSYGNDAEELRQLIRERPELGQPLHPELPHVQAECIWAARQEMARTLEDVLARRLRALFLNAWAATAAAPRVAMLLAEELGRDDRWQAGQVASFRELAAHYTWAQPIPSDATN
jgi:glycerol-3-phosphate dehydrogenase